MTFLAFEEITLYARTGTVLYGIPFGVRLKMMWYYVRDNTTNSIVPDELFRLYYSNCIDLIVQSWLFCFDWTILFWHSCTITLFNWWDIFILHSALTHLLLSRLNTLGCSTEFSVWMYHKNVGKFLVRKTSREVILFGSWKEKFHAKKR